MAFLKLLKTVGDSGRFQLLHAILMCIPLLVVPSHHLIQNFTAATPRHHCQILRLENASKENLLRVAIPWEHDSLSKCSRYVQPQWQLMLNDSADVSDHVQIEGCVDGWEFDSSEFSSTIVTEVKVSGFPKLVCCGRLAHRWTWYSNAGGVAKEIDHVLVDGHWRMIQNGRVYQSAQFLNTNHRLVEATLKLHLKSRRMLPSQRRLDVGKLKDERVAEEFANRLSGDLEGSFCFGET
uniref:Uncharacterized protein n=1 Tax=Eptatretus burgeri TaxID=7764 RepID=A0A8C4QJ79_EPTBU